MDRGGREGGVERRKSGQWEGEADGDLGCFFFFNDAATTEIYTLSLHDALPISRD